MKRIILCALAIISVASWNEDLCKSIEAWTNDAEGKDIKMMESGLISKNFDQRITQFDDLYNLDENSHIQSIFLTSKVALQ
jgi:hypothetical protein